jgi:hypothetical protein
VEILLLEQVLFLIDMVPIFSGRNDGEIATLNASSDLFTYSPPSGFSAWGS